MKLKLLTMRSLARWGRPDPVADLEYNLLFHPSESP